MKENRKQAFVARQKVKRDMKNGFCMISANFRNGMSHKALELPVSKNP